MGAKQWDPQLPTIYLDQSTWSAAFRSFGLHDPQASPSYRRLFRWLEASCADLNVCINLAHVQELASAGTEGSHWNANAAKDMAAWLDGLPLVWTAHAERVRTEEAIHWLRRAAGLQADEPRVFVGSLLIALRPDDGECVFRSTRALVPVAPEQPFRCTRAPSERSDDPLARGTYLPFTI